MGDRDTASLPTDPPIIIGGGGSTLIWIRKDQHARKIPSTQVPYGAETPAHPDSYDIFILDGFDCASVKVNDGGGNSASHSTRSKSHHTIFE